MREYTGPYSVVFHAVRVWVTTRGSFACIWLLITCYALIFSVGGGLFIIVLIDEVDVSVFPSLGTS